MPEDKGLIITCLLTLIATLMSVPQVSAIAPQTRVRLEPADLVVSLHEAFALQVMIEEASDLGAFEFDLIYDPATLQVKEATLGDFLGSTGRSAVPIGPEVDNAEGRVTFGAISFGSGPGPSGMGILATITFIAQGEGSTALELREVQILDTAANVQEVTVEGGWVVARGAATPTSIPTATPVPTATATPVPISTPQAVNTPTPTAIPLPPPTPIGTSPAVKTPTKTPVPSPTPIATSPTVEMPTEVPPPWPTPAVTGPVEMPTKAPPPSPVLGIAPTEAKPAEKATSPIVPTEGATPVAMKAAPASTTAPLPPTSKPSPTPLATVAASALTGLSGWAALRLLLAALAAIILGAFVLGRR